MLFSTSMSDDAECFTVSGRTVCVGHVMRWRVGVDVCALGQWPYLHGVGLVSP